MLLEMFLVCSSDDYHRTERWTPLPDLQTLNQHASHFHNSFWSHLFLSISWGLINLNLASIVSSWSDSFFIPAHSDNC